MYIKYLDHSTQAFFGLPGIQIRKNSWCCPHCQSAGQLIWFCSTLSPCINRYLLLKIRKQVRLYLWGRKRKKLILSFMWKYQCYLIVFNNIVYQHFQTFKAVFCVFMGKANTSVLMFGLDVKLNLMSWLIIYCLSSLKALKKEPLFLPHKVRTSFQVFQSHKEERSRRGFIEEDLTYSNHS